MAANDESKGAKKSFEKALGRLEQIVRQLDEGGLSLEQSMKLFEEGQKLAQVCGEQLDDADRQIQLLIRAHDGKGERRTEIGPDGDIDAAVDAALDGEDADADANANEVG